jgi:hypothetical protein
MPAVLVLLLELLAGPLGAATELAGAPAGMAALAVVGAAALLLTLLVAVHTTPVAGALAPSAVRQHGERTVFLALCDPDAAGRPRPRAPSLRPGVA